MAKGRQARLVAATGVAAAALTLVMVLTPIRFSYESTELRVALETAQAVIAGLVALLLYGRHRRSGLWGDLLAAYSLFLLGAVSLFSALIPALAEPTPDGRLDRFHTWAPILARTAAGAALAAAAVVPRRWCQLPRRGLATAAALAATIAVVSLVAWAALDSLPSVVPEEFPPSSSQRPDLDAPGALLAAQLVQVALSAVAAVGFGRRARRDAGPLVAALAAGCVLAAFARLNFFLYPSIYTDVVHVGDVLRLLFYLVLLAGAAAEITGYWRVEAEAIRARERQRLARELHDGLSQELAFIRSHTAAMAKGASHPGVTPLVAEAAERAMVESRRVVDALRAEGGTSLEALLADVAGDTVRAAGAAVEVSVDPRLWLPAEAQHELSELVRRTVAAAVRVRAATTVSVRLAVVDRRAVLAVEDDGTGIESPGAREQAQRELEAGAGALGATCRSVIRPGGGTRIEVALPWRPARTSSGWWGRAGAETGPDGRTTAG